MAAPKSPITAPGFPLRLAAHFALLQTAKDDRELKELVIKTAGELLPALQTLTANPLVCTLVLRAAAIMSGYEGLKITEDKPELESKFDALQSDIDSAVLAATKGNP